jgi:hypothetical protein
MLVEQRGCVAEPPPLDEAAAAPEELPPAEMSDRWLQIGRTILPPLLHPRSQRGPLSTVLINDDHVPEADRPSPDEDTASGR